MHNRVTASKLRSTYVYTERMKAFIVYSSKQIRLSATKKNDN